VTVEIRLLGPDDGAVLDRVAPDVFDYPVAPRWAAEFLGDPRHHLAVALDDGVVPTHQRQGIAGRLLAALLDHGARLGCVQGWVLTSPANTAARQLYARAGGREAEELSVMVEFPLAPGGR
jgi:GNAT superfamily N-acetyltransferase